ncbi:MAG: hypothetical protein AB7S57_18780 [Acetobacteraceae bacterium]
MPIRPVLALAIALLLGGCVYARAPQPVYTYDPTDPGQRAVAGGVIGAGAGAAIGGLTGGGQGAAIGALAGGALGAAAGAATAEQRRPYDPYYGDPRYSYDPRYEAPYDPRYQGSYYPRY